MISNDMAKKLVNRKKTAYNRVQDWWDNEGEEKLTRLIIFCIERNYTILVFDADNLDQAKFVQNKLHEYGWKIVCLDGWYVRFMIDNDA